MKLNIDKTKDDLLPRNAVDILKDRYLLPTETSPQEAFARARALEYETQQGQFTFFGHPQGQQNYYNSYQPYQALQR